MVSQKRKSVVGLKSCVELNWHGSKVLVLPAVLAAKYWPQIYFK